MTTIHSILLVPSLLTLVLLSSCQSTQKSEKEPQDGKVTTAPTSRTAPETKVVLTPKSVETKPSKQKKSGGTTNLPVSSPSSAYTEDRLHDLEKGLRRLQSLPSTTQSSKTGTRKRNL